MCLNKRTVNIKKIRKNKAMNNTQKNELISVILPVYNVEPYLERSLGSVVSQTYKNLEIILVDDGSTDNSGDICDRYSMKDSRIRTFHISHRGLGAARNYGFEESHGKYILYVDSDDRIGKDFVEILYDRMHKTDADFVESRLLKSASGYLFKPKNRKKIESKAPMSGPEYMKYVLTGDAAVSSCGKLFKRELLEKVESVPGRLFEDRAIICKLVHYSSRIVLEDDAVYYYYMRRPKSITSTFSKKAAADSIWAFKTFSEDCIRYYPEYSEKAEMVFKSVYLFVWKKLAEIIPLRYLLFPALLKDNNKSAYILLRKTKAYIRRHYDDYMKMSLMKRLQVKSICHFPFVLVIYSKLGRIHV